MARFNATELIDAGKQVAEELGLPVANADGSIDQGEYDINAARENFGRWCEDRDIDPDDLSDVARGYSDGTAGAALRGTLPLGEAFTSLFVSAFTIGYKVRVLQEADDA